MRCVWFCMFFFFFFFKQKTAYEMVRSDWSSDVCSSDLGGGSWRRTVTLRDATADPARLRTALAPKLADLPAPLVMLRLEALVLAESVGNQLELVRPEGDELRAHLSEGLRQVRAGTGSGSVCTVVEVAPWSRLPEQRALLVPRDD